MIGEVLSGATRLSFLYVLVPEIMVWGGGALMMRELVRRWRAGWTSLLLLGFGLTIAEEFLIQQTSLAPLPFLGSAPGYGRLYGVNWPYFAFMLAYEAVWIVLVPVQLTELLFPVAREETWLRARGWAVVGGFFLLGSFIAWYTWTQQARPNMFHVPVYTPPSVTLALGALAIVLLAVAAHAVRGADAPVRARTSAPPWVLVLAALAMGFPWYGLMVVVFAPNVTAPLGAVMAAAGAWAIGVYAVVRRWAVSAGWTDAHRWALCFGALLVCMIAGFLGASGWPRLDTLGKAVLNLIAAAGMIVLWRQIQRRGPRIDRT